MFVTVKQREIGSENRDFTISEVHNTASLPYNGNLFFVMYAFTFIFMLLFTASIGEAS